MSRTSESLAETESKSNIVSSSKTSIKIGGAYYDLEVSKIPYLSSLVNFRINAQQTSELVHGPIPLFDIALKGIEKGYRQCFRTLPPDLSQHHILCETYEFLCIDVLGRQSINEIFNDLKACKSDYELEYKHYREIKGDKSKARDAAFRLLYLILLGEFENETKDSAKVFNAVLFIVSHSGTFKWRTRTVVRAAYEERFVVTERQRLRLDQWEKTDPTELAAEDKGDATTEEDESDGFYVSDYSD